MLANIIGLVSCLLCALPFLIVSVFGRDSATPVTFWSGDKTLDGKVRDIPRYNTKMAKLYGACAKAFAIAGICCLAHLAFGLAVLAMVCTVGCYWAWRAYKKILNECEAQDKG